MKRVRKVRFVLVLVAGATLLTASGCQMLRQVANLRLVDFALDRVTNVNLAGVSLDRVQSYEDLRATEIARIAAALTQNRLPVEFKLHVLAENPEENGVEARMVEMDWTLFLEDRETISGVMGQDFLMLPGTATDIPIDIRLDLVSFFGDNLRDLVNIALSLAGQGGAPTNVRLQAMPTIQTPIGPIRYPQPITIVSRDVG